MEPTIKRNLNQERVNEIRERLGVRGVALVVFNDADTSGFALSGNKAGRSGMPYFLDQVSRAMADDHAALNPPYIDLDWEPWRQAH